MEPKEFLVHVGFMICMVLLVFIIASAVIQWNLIVNSHEVQIIEQHSGQDITAEFKNAQQDSGRECNAGDRYSKWTRYICVESIRENITESEQSRGATSNAHEYFMYDFIYDNRTHSLEKNKLYFIEYDNQLGYCSGPGKITLAKKVMDYCDECTYDPDGRQMGCCAKEGCK